ncbi:Sm-like protein LSM7 [Capsicum annuum]|nr:Sm-like protein LSM7 [Capsicum annuum]
MGGSKLSRFCRKETVLDLAKFVDKGVQVKLTGGRQVVGTLKGYDQLLNLVLDEAVEHLRGVEADLAGFTDCPPFLQIRYFSRMEQQIAYVDASELFIIDNSIASEKTTVTFHADDPLKTTDQKRSLGLIVCRGTAVMLVAPTDGTDEISNPFLQPDGA